MKELAAVNTCRSFLQRRKQYKILLQQALIRFTETVLVIKTDLEETERASWREISDKRIFSSMYSSAYRMVYEFSSSFEENM